MIHGFDVSHWDGTVEWPLIPKDYKFVFIKATEGGYVSDPLAGQHFTGAEGRLRSFYHFWRYGYSASQQANQFVAEIRKHGTPELPPVIDLEDIRAPKAVKRLPKTLDTDRMARLLGAPAHDPLARRDHAMMELLYSSGLRLAELVGLDLTDLDLGLTRCRSSGFSVNFPIWRTARRIPSPNR